MSEWVTNAVYESAKESDDDYSLLRRFYTGDKKAFEIFYRRYYQRFMKIAVYYCKDVHFAEDMVQETFLKTLNLKVRLGFVRNIKNYVYRILINMCKDLTKHKKTEQATEQIINLLSSQDNIEQKIDFEKVNDVIDSLPQRQKEVLLLRHKAELEFREIADILGISQNNAKVSYFYAVASLKKIFGERI